MSLKSLAFNLANRVSDNNATPLTRSHAYELIAAAFGYQSYAAFSQTAVALFKCDQHDHINHPTFINRLQQLHCTHAANDITQSLQVLIEENAVRAVTLVDLIKGLNSGDLLCDEEQLILSLEEQSSKTGLGNYALGLALISSADLDQNEQDPYWYNQLKMGRALGPNEEIFACEYQANIKRLERAKQCFIQSAQLGCKLGLLGLTLHFNDNQFFEKSISPNDLVYETYDPIEIANMAQDMDYKIEYSSWLLDACGHGNIEAIRMAAEKMQDDSLVFCHALAELSALLGEDIRQESFCMVDESGFEKYDDYGPGYADGYYAIELRDISNSDKVLAQSLAQKWLTEIQQTGRAQCESSQL